MKINALFDYISQETGHSLNSDEGLMVGDAEKELTKILFCWMADREAIAAAARAACSHMVAHESVFHPYNAYEKERTFGEWHQWAINQARLEALQRGALALARIHGSMDEITIHAAFARRLRLGEPLIEKEGLVRIYEVGGLELAALVSRVKEAVGMERVRAAIPKGFRRKIFRVGLPWGGLGLFVNVGYQQSLIAAEVDALIGGESDSYGMRFAVEQDIPFIETSHEVSENPGIQLFAERVSQDLGVETLFFENHTPWVVW